MGSKLNSDFKYCIFKVGIADSGRLVEVGNELNAEYARIVRDNVPLPMFRGLSLYSKEVLDYYEDMRKRKELLNKASGKLNEVARGSVAGYSGVIWQDRVAIDIDCKQEGPEVARLNTIELMRRLIEDHKIDPAFLTVCYSGKKGFHVYIPQALIGFNAAKGIWHGVHKFVKALCNTGDHPVKYDTELYKSQMCLRMPLSINDSSGLYAIPLPQQDFAEGKWSLEQIMEAAKTRTPVGKKAIPATEIVDSLLRLWPAEVEYEKEKVTISRSEDDMSQEQAAAAGIQLVNNKQRMCIQAMMKEDVPEGERNTVVFRIASHMANRGDTPDMVRAAMNAWYSRQTQKMEKFHFDSTVNDAIARSIFYACSDDALAKRCDKRCFMYETHVKGKEEKHSADDFRSLAQLKEEYMKIRTENRVVSFGIDEIDKACGGGIAPGEVCLLYGRAGSGKTMFAMFLAHQIAKRTGGYVLFFEMELGDYLLFERSMMLSMDINHDVLADIHSTSKETGATTFDDLVDAASEEMAGMRFCKKTSLTTQDKIELINKFTEKYGKPVAVFEDYLGLGKAPGINQTERIGSLAKDLKNIAKECDVPYFSLVQIARKQGEDHTTPLNMFSGKDSSEIEQGGDYIFALYRRDYGKADESIITIQILKSRRGGECFELNLKWKRTGGKYVYDPFINYPFVNTKEA